METADDPAALFERARPRLFGMAYRMMGSVADAEDLVQETYVRWHEADRRGIRSPEGWLMSVIGRLSIDRLRRASVERTAYVANGSPSRSPPGSGRDPIGRRTSPPTCRWLFSSCWNGWPLRSGSPS